MCQGYTVCITHKSMNNTNSCKELICRAQANNTIYVPTQFGVGRKLTVNIHVAFFFHEQYIGILGVTEESGLNDFFQLGPEIWEQFTGVMIGGELALHHCQ